VDGTEGLEMLVAFEEIFEDASSFVGFVSEAVTCGEGAVDRFELSLELVLARSSATGKPDRESAFVSSASLPAPTVAFNLLYSPEMPPCISLASDLPSPFDAAGGSV
jgi:hypothetical protein